MIRKLENRWLDGSIQLVKEYSQDLGFSSQFNFQYTARKLQDMEICLVYTVGDEVEGLVGGSIYPSPWNHKVRAFHEEIFYLRPSMRGKGVGREMLTEFMDSVDSLDTDMSTMKLMHNSPDIEKLYKEHDYNKLETTYIRR